MSLLRSVVSWAKVESTVYYILLLKAHLDFLIFLYPKGHIFMDDTNENPYKGVCTIEQLFKSLLKCEVCERN